MVNIFVREQCKLAESDWTLGLGEAAHLLQNQLSPLTLGEISWMRRSTLAVFIITLVQ